MERTKLWSAAEDDSSSEESSSSLSDHEVDSNSAKSKASDRKHTGKLSKKRKIDAKSGKQRNGAVDFEALKRFGYRGGPSVLGVPEPKEVEKQDWTWATGKERQKKNDEEETYEERQKTRAALTNGEQLATSQVRDQKKNISFSQKEKRKRDLGQASRGKNYVEEEKRSLRDSGVYSGFDT